MKIHVLLSAQAKFERIQQKSKAIKYLKNSLVFFFLTHRKKSLVFLFGIFLLWYFCLPSPLFDDSTSMVLTDRNNELLSARIAADGQWRFPQNENIPDKFIAAIIEFEDRRFFSHFGIDPIGIFRAIEQNISSGKIVSGGSTLTMQTARLTRKNKPRNITQKFIEMCMATRLEFKYSKSEILAFYASNAPFGGNVVGLEAASWRYYSKRPELLSWGEAATLAVLPNSPALIHPGRNRNALFEKRNRLLDKLLIAGKMDELTCKLAKEEPLPAKPLPLPNIAPHLLDRAFSEKIRGKKSEKTLVNSTIDRSLQNQLNSLIQRKNKILKSNEIHNLAAIIIDVKTGETLAYVGNAKGTGNAHKEYVDIVKANRSTGSILKPYLYAFSLENGNTTPQSLLPDVPTNLGGYKPENYNQQYDGRVSADKALIRSLNVPFVLLLKDYGVEKFHNDLQKIGLTSITRTPNDYGLSLILGGAEGNLWDITGAYASMSRTLNNFQPQNGQYYLRDFRSAHYDLKKERKEDFNLLNEAPRLSAASIYSTFQAMKNLERPNALGEWERFGSGRQVAWKTGTSFGFRDAWAVGVTPDYAVGVWAGNADGEGRPGCIGVVAAAPVLFDIFALLPNKSNWFKPPFDEMTEISVCQKSGFRAGEYCEIDSVFVPNNCLKSASCPYHKQIHLDPTGRFQVTANCLSPANMQHRSWFVLPPVAEYFYKSKHPDYQTLPPFGNGCNTAETDAVMQFIYPKENTQIFIPKDMNGEKSRTVFEVAHRNSSKTLYWHIDEEYMGSTTDFHSLEVLPEVGKHLLVLVDDDGERAEIIFEVVN